MKAIGRRSSTSLRNLSGKLTGRQREQVAGAVANTNECDYCLSAHNLLGSLQGLTKPELEAASGAVCRVKGREGCGDPAFRRQVVNERGHLPTSEVATLRAAGVSDQEIVEVIATVAVNIFTNYFDQFLARRSTSRSCMPRSGRLDKSLPSERITGPSTRASSRCTSAASSVMEVSGSWAEATRRPLARSSGITRFQLEPSAHAA